MIERIFHYYLNTIVFSPKVDWDTFVRSYSDYMNIVIDDYVLNEYTDFLFSYVDSGDFSVTFNPKLYDPKVIWKQKCHDQKSDQSIRRGSRCYLWL